MEITNISSIEAIQRIQAGLSLENFHVEAKLSFLSLGGSCHQRIEIKNCIVDEVVGDMVEFEDQVMIQSTTLLKSSFNGSYFKGGLLLKDCQFKSYVDFEAGGHNLKEIRIENCMFEGYVNFFDCWFRDKVIVTGNSFQNGSNLLGNLGEPFQCRFDCSPIIENNIGKLDLDGEGDKVINTIILR